MIAQHASVQEEVSNDEPVRAPKLTQGTHVARENGADSQIPKAKRIACVLCRRRKLRCDGAKPSCATCSRLSHGCEYDEVRKKSGPRRGYVKQLEARLAQVETMLKTHDETSVDIEVPPSNSVASEDLMADIEGVETSFIIPSLPDMAYTNPLDYVAVDVPQHATPLVSEHVSHHVELGPSLFDSYSRELMGMDLDEALPTQEVMVDLDYLYFQRIHPVAPLIHPSRYYTALRLPPRDRPPVCLRYAMWASVASVVDQYDDLRVHFYQRARKYAERDEMRGHGETMVSLRHVQCWHLLGMLEFKWTYFPRAWMSAGRAGRLAQMMGLHRIDHVGLDVKQCLPPPRDWTDKEERRRTYWMCFIGDRLASIGTGWPTSLDEKDIYSCLPSDEHAFENSIESRGVRLEEALKAGGTATISSLGGVALMACIFGRNLVHLHRPTPMDAESDLNGEFWTRHRELDDTISNIALGMSDNLRMPAGLQDVNTIAFNLSLHTANICLHQAAIFKADAQNLPPFVAAESKVRCITAAAETASIMRMISHTDLSNTSVFTSFCLYVAARVFVQYLKSRPNDGNIKASLHFLLTAMQTIRRKNLLTESLLVQLDLDLQGAGLEESRSLRNRLSKMSGSNRLNNMTCKGKSGAHHAATFGDNGLSSHTNPGQTSMACATSMAKQFDSVAMARPSPVSVSQDATNLRAHSMQTMPNRSKTPSLRPSPATASDEMTDLTFETYTESTSPDSFNFSSHTSSSEQTPPTFHNDVQNFFWSNDSGVKATDTLKTALTPMSDAEFQAMMGQYTQPMYTNTSSTVQNIGLGGGPEDMTFTMPNFDLSPDSSSQSQYHSGMTSGPSMDGVNASDDEWRHIVNSGMLDMGWECTGGIPTAH